MRLAYISLALVGLMWIVPFLHDTHEYPLTTFDQEWWTVVLGMAAMFVLLTKQYWQAPEVPRIVLLPLVLIAIVLVQLALGKVVYFQQGLLYVLYFLFAALLMLLGASLRRSLGLEVLAGNLAIFLLVGTALSTAIGILQHFGWHTWFDPVIVRKVASSLYGNVAQPNHYANYLALGLVSMGLLYQQKKLDVIYVIPLAATILFVMTLSGSRSSWLYMLLMAGFAALSWYKNRTLRPLLGYTLALIVGFALMHLIVQLPFLSGADAETNSLARFANSDTNGSIRWYLWREAVMIFAQSPIIGVGFGQFAFHHFQLLPELQPKNIVGLYNNAHDIVFQLAAEAGIAGVLALLATVGAWLYGLRRVTATAIQWWCFAAVGVLGIHSLLEYPLWYTYFLGILAFLLGALDETHYRLELRNTGRISLLLIWVLGWATMAQLQMDYSDLKVTLATQAASGNTPDSVSRTKEGLTALRKSVLLAPYADLFASSFTEINPQDVKAKLASNGAVMRYIPTAESTYRQALLLAQDGQLDAAKKLYEQAIWSYPGNAGVHGLLMALQQHDPEHFSALLEFANQKEQEHDLAIRHE